MTGILPVGGAIGEKTVFSTAPNARKDASYTLLPASQKKLPGGAMYDRHLACRRGGQMKESEYLRQFIFPPQTHAGLWENVKRLTKQIHD